LHWPACGGQAISPMLACAEMAGHCGFSWDFARGTRSR